MASVSAVTARWKSPAKNACLPSCRRSSAENSARRAAISASSAGVRRSSRAALSSTRTMCWHIDTPFADRLSAPEPAPNERAAVIADPATGMNDAQPHVEVFRASQRLVEETGRLEYVAARQNRHHHVAPLADERLDRHRPRRRMHVHEAAGRREEDRRMSSRSHRRRRGRRARARPADTRGSRAPTRRRNRAGPRTRHAPPRCRDFSRRSGRRFPERCIGYGLGTVPTRLRAQQYQASHR